jgi:hypothetical protein
LHGQEYRCGIYCHKAISTERQAVRKVSPVSDNCAKFFPLSRLSPHGQRKTLGLHGILHYPPKVVDTLDNGIIRQ